MVGLEKESVVGVHLGLSMGYLHARIFSWDEYLEVNEARAL